MTPPRPASSPISASAPIARVGPAWGWTRSARRSRARQAASAASDQGLTTSYGGQNPVIRRGHSPDSCGEITIGVLAPAFHSAGIPIGGRGNRLNWKPG